MNKDDHCSLTLQDRFNLYLSDPAVERELIQVKRPTINVENLPSSIYYRQVGSKSNAKNQQKKGSSTTQAASTGNRRTKKQDQKKNIKANQAALKAYEDAKAAADMQRDPEENDEDLGNEKLTELMRCAACL